MEDGLSVPLWWRNVLQSRAKPSERTTCICFVSAKDSSGPDTLSWCTAQSDNGLIRRSRNDIWKTVTFK